MNKEFIPYKQAIALKKLGFDEPCFGCYDEKTIFGLTVMSIKQYYTNSKEDTWNCAAPLYQQAFRWFREKHNLDSSIALVADGYGFYIHKNRNYTNKGENYGMHITYEEAELACLDKLIELTFKTKINCKTTR